MRRIIMASGVDPRSVLLSACASLVLACAGEVDPRGTWEGTYAPRPGEEAVIVFEVGERWDYPTLIAHESVRWRVYDVEGHVEGWFDFHGGLFHCVLGPCRLNTGLGATDDSGANLPEVEEGGFAILGMGQGSDAQHCAPHLDVGIPWHVRMFLDPVQGARRPQTEGSARVGDWCSPLDEPWPARGNADEGPVNLRRIEPWEEE